MNFIYFILKTQQMLSRALKQKAQLCQPVCARAFGHKIKVANPVVDMDGDEMTKIIWKWIKERVSYLIKQFGLSANIC